ncbi:GSCFA domain-containing protein [Lichenibacterium ramalinae]|uniref:GSCFA domain-containing protein n=1 Tax=Lichenibacterium ramalinae TaxID=2316527 RepID=A0A4Q2R8B0_9HYPH|nr:GSCFA domain-containing protein [Lichenibacterium ramalinae]RYB03050.1 hypothetical protein D3272_18440 [Lichenibacterium ramalinae]
MVEGRHHPYKDQPARAFWRRSVEGVHPLEIGGWYRRKFSLEGRRLATGGSCFAQHIGREMKRRGADYLDVEPAPGFLPPAMHLDHGYGIYSARYGNLYTSRQLLQLLQRAAGEIAPADRAWERDGGYVDPFRPNIEPGPVGTADEVEALRRHHLSRVVALFEQTDAFVFTLGMTETWMARQDGTVFPVAPGTAGGIWDEARYRFLNLTYPEVVADLEEVIARLRAINGDMHFIFTVSPVSIMATATPDHVVVANTHSKSILRAAAGALAERYPFVDYFPGYEITTSPPMRAMFYDTDMRTVASAGVRHVMEQFFAEHAPVDRRAAAGRVKVGAPARHDAGAAPGGAAPAAPGPDGSEPAPAGDAERLLCDEELASVFGRY